MIELIRNTETFGDCTAGYEVTLGKQYTVREFIAEVLTRKEWGKIKIVGNFENPFCEYKGTAVIVEMPNEFLDKTIIGATAHGGWGSMDYRLRV